LTFVFTERDCRIDRNGTVILTRHLCQLTNFGHLYFYFLFSRDLRATSKLVLRRTGGIRPPLDVFDLLIQHHLFGDEKRRKINLGGGIESPRVRVSFSKQREDDIMKGRSKNARAMLLYKSIVVARSQRGRGGQDTSFS